ncbi:MAG TPA: hypothetical protein DCF68_17790 [Cyanothece sp. UBA12306]|nr:hypothetical protein [Cyanothece sp. UBA12306]
MKLQNTTWSLLITAILLCAGVYLYEVNSQEKQEKLEAQQQSFFDFSAENIQKLTIKTQEKTLEFERNKDKKKPWKMTQPKQQIANDAVVSFLINLLVTAESDRNFTIPANQKKDYGFDPPSATFKIELDNYTYHQLIVGKSDFKNEFLYAMIDPKNKEESEIEISLVSQDFQTTLDKKVDEWLEIDSQDKPSEKTEDSQQDSVE